MKANQAAILSLILMCAGATTEAARLGTAFTYEGRLSFDGQPAEGLYDFSFDLYDAETSTVPVGTTWTQTRVPVQNGLFRTEVDFGLDAFDGDGRWLEISVRTNGLLLKFTILKPRQPLSPTPYSLHSIRSSTASSVGVNAVTTGAIVNGAVTAEKIKAGEVVKSLNGLTDDVTLAAGDNITITPTGNTLTIVGSGGGGAGWSLTGNAGTTPGVNFLGTTDSNPLELRANNATALRLGFSLVSPTILGGYQANSIGSPCPGSTIGGGGYSGGPNIIDDNTGYAFIGGGARNRIAAQSRNGTIVGGLSNTIASGAIFALIGGGSSNVVAGEHSTVAGGRENLAQGNYTSVGGGYGNTVDLWGNGSTIAGGFRNGIGYDSQYGSIAGGYHNQILTNSPHSSIGGGYFNWIATNADSATISGGHNNSNATTYATIGGGIQNSIGIYAFSATIAGGGRNAIGTGANDTVIGGGLDNRIGNQSPFSVVTGGQGNVVDSDAAHNAIGGGQGNTIQIFSDPDLRAWPGWSTVSGGRSNDIQGGTCATVSGGEKNLVWVWNSTNSWAVIGGGRSNSVGGICGTVPGGIQNSAWHFAFAAGSRARAAHQGSFVWGDASSALVSSTNDNSVTMRASGGYRLFSNSGATVGARLAAGSGSWSSMCDRNAKENFSPVNGREMLDKVAALNLSTWNYKSQPPSTRHLGPMAQDFHAAFGVGEDDKTISSVDADGVALAAIQGLNQKLEEEVISLRAANSTLQRELSELKNLMNTLTEKLNGGE